MATVEQRVDPGVLVARAVLLAGVSVLLGLAAHLAVGGVPPGAGVLVLLTALAFVACLRLLRRPAGTTRLVAVLVGGQALAHLALSATAGGLGASGAGGGTGAATRAAPGALALPVDAGRRVGSLQDSHDVATGHVDLTALPVGHLVHELPGHAPLLLAHLLAAVALGLGLALGERCLWTLLSLLTASVLRLLAPLAALVTTGPTPRPSAGAVRRPRSLGLLARSVVRRGPPVRLAVA